LLTAFYEFIIRELCVLVSVHIPKYLVHTLFGRVFVSGELDHLTSHLVDGGDDLEHLVVGDEAVLVNVIQLECPLELFVQAATTGYTEGADEFLKVDRTVLVFVKDVEYIVCELARVAKREELLVYATKFGPIEVARWTVPEESLVPRAGLEKGWAGSRQGDHCCSSLLSTV